MSSLGGEQVVPELRKTVFGSLAEKKKKWYSGKLAFSVTNLIILPQSLTLEVFCFPLLLPVTISAQNQMTAGFTFLSQRKIERERERKTGVIWSGPGRGFHRVTGNLDYADV